MAQNTGLAGFLRRQVVFSDDPGGGGGAALAIPGQEPAGAPDLLAMAGFGIGEDGALTPLPVAPAAPKQTEQQQGGSTIVVVGNENLTPEQAAARITQLSSELVAAKPLMEVGETFALVGQKYGAPAQHWLMDQVEQLQIHGGIPPEDDGVTPLVVNPLDIPDGYRVPVVKLDEMSDGEQYVYSVISAVKADLELKLKELARLLTGIQSYLGNVHAETQDQKTAEALRVLGMKNATARTVQELRDKGVSDPVKWFRHMQTTKSNGVVPPATNGEAPPEAPASATDKVFDADEVDPAMIGWYLNNGYRPRNPADLDRLTQLAKQFG